jgi:pilus assembly protein CpaE
MSRVVLIGADSVLERQARRLLGDEVVVLAPASSDVLVSRLIWLERRPELVILGGDMPPVLALWIARSVRDLTDSIAMVGDDPAVYEQSLASGVTEFLGTEVDLEELDALLTRTRDHAIRISGAHAPARSAAPHLPGAVIAVTSPKGGVGKTTVATNLAIALQDLVGNRRGGGRVVLVDLDLQFGDVSTALGLAHRHSIVDALSKAAARDSFVLGTFLAQHVSGISVLAAPASPAAADLLDPSRVGHLLRQLIADFDYIVVDTSPGLSDATLAAIEQASAIVAVAGLDVPSTRGLRTALDMLRELQLEPPIRQIVLNQIAPRAGMSVADAEQVLAASVDVVIPSRRAVALGLNRGIAVLESAPRDPAARALRSLARRLHDILSRRELFPADPRNDPRKDPRTDPHDPRITDPREMVS